MYSFSYLEPVCCSMSSSNCCFLTWTLSSCWIQDYKPQDMSFLILSHIALLRCVISKIQNTEKWTLSLQMIQHLWAKRANLTVIDCGKLPAESYHVSTAHQKAVKMENTSVCRQWCCNLHLGLTWMSRGRGWELKPTWFWFSLWLETIHPQDTFLSLREGCEKWKTGYVWLWEILSPEYQL